MNNPTVLDQKVTLLSMKEIGCSTYGTFSRHGIKVDVLSFLKTALGQKMLKEFKAL
jgi:hypothetical protein